MKNYEQELKISLTEREYNILSQVANTQAVEQVNYYFSSESSDISTMVRLRKKGESFLLCYKHRLTHTNGVIVSDELECELKADYAQTLIERGITAKELKNFFQRDFYDDIVCIGKLTTYRTKFQMEEWSIELDKNVYFDKCDYELECENTDVRALEKLKSYLVYHYGIVIRPSITKFERFLTARKSQK